MADEEERSREDHQEAVIAFTAGAAQFPKEQKRALSEACYTHSELGLWPADLELSEADAISIWAIVEAVRQKGFPDDLRM